MTGKPRRSLTCPEDMAAFRTGIHYALSGFYLIGKPGIRFYVLLPLLINTLLFSLVIMFGANLLNDLVQSLTPQWTWLEWIKWLIWPLFVVLSMAMVFFCFSIIANLVGAPFNGFLSGAVERHLSAQAPYANQDRKLLEEILHAFSTECRKFLYFALRALPLLVLFIIPFIQLGAPFIWCLFSAWMLVLEYMEYPGSNHGMTFNALRQTLFKNRQLAFGFGLTVMLLTLTPVINFIVMPVAVAGATKMYLEQGQLQAK